MSAANTPAPADEIERLVEDALLAANKQGQEDDFEGCHGGWWSSVITAKAAVLKAVAGLRAERDGAVHLAMLRGGQITRLQTDLWTANEQAIEAEARALALEAQVGEMRDLAYHIACNFVHEGHPGRPCLQSGWVDVEHVRDWHRQIEAAKSAPSEALARHDEEVRGKALREAVTSGQYRRIVTQCGLCGHSYAGSATEDEKHGFGKCDGTALAGGSHA